MLLLLGPVSMSDRSLKELFHFVGRVLPEEQELVSLKPDDTVEQALSMMLQRNLSQVPVLYKTQILGVFTFRSLAMGLTRLTKAERSPLTLPVEEFVEELHLADTNVVLTELLEEFDRKDAVLIGTREKIQGVVTTLDALNYFYQVANCYVLLGEIELSLRELIRQSVSDKELQECINDSLKQPYSVRNEPLPEKIEMLTLYDCVLILRFKGHWDIFQPAFGGTRDTTYTKLKELPDLRNTVFHFRRKLTVAEYDRLREARDWLHRRMKKISADQLVQDNG